MRCNADVFSVAGFLDSVKTIPNVFELKFQYLNLKVLIRI